MILERVLKHSKTLIEQVTKAGDVTIDCTVGNGHDTLFLSQLVGETGKVYGFDIQLEAIEQTQATLLEHRCQNTQLFHTGHQHLLDHVEEAHKGRVSSAIFNLGYLPNGDENIATQGKTTIQAIESLLPILKKHGLIILVVYSGHEQGKQEKDDLLNYVKTLDQKQAHVLMYRFLNQREHAPFIIAIEKVK